MGRYAASGAWNRLRENGGMGDGAVHQCVSLYFVIQFAGEPLQFRVSHHPLGLHVWMRVSFAWLYIVCKNPRLIGSDVPVCRISVSLSGWLLSMKSRGC